MAPNWLGKISWKFDRLAVFRSSCGALLNARQPGRRSQEGSTALVLCLAPCVLSVVVSPPPPAATLVKELEQAGALSCFQVARRMSSPLLSIAHSGARSKSLAQHASLTFGQSTANLTSTGLVSMSTRLALISINCPHINLHPGNSATLIYASALPAFSAGSPAAPLIPTGPQSSATATTRLDTPARTT